MLDCDVLLILFNPYNIEVKCASLHSHPELNFQHFLNASYFRMFIILSSASCQQNEEEHKSTEKNYFVMNNSAVNLHLLTYIQQYSIILLIS